jgi:regulator of protease activity HflC (stomatin/prohibitin superfamily)
MKIRIRWDGVEYTVWEWIKLQWMPISLTLFALLFLLFFLSDRIFIFVYPGQAGVVWRRFAGGTDLKVVYGEGMHIVPPWNKVYVYNVRIQQLTQEDVALANNGLAVTVKSSFRFKPNYTLLPKLHQDYGPDYIQKTVVPEVSAAIQEIVGQFDPEQIYHLQRELAEQQMSIDSKRFLGWQFVDIYDVHLTRILLPDKVQAAIQGKAEEEQLSLLYDFRIQAEQKEAQRKEIEARGIAEFQRIVSSGISNQLLMWKGIEATQELAKSPNTKVVVIGNSKNGLPVILGGLDEKPK